MGTGFFPGLLTYTTTKQADKQIIHTQPTKPQNSTTTTTHLVCDHDRHPELVCQLLQAAQEAAQLDLAVRQLPTPRELRPGQCGCVMGSL